MENIANPVDNVLDLTETLMDPQGNNLTKLQKCNVLDTLRVFQIKFNLKQNYNLQGLLRARSSAATD